MPPASWGLVDANISMLFTELPLTGRPAAARAAGFTAIEAWWPFGHVQVADVPGRHEPGTGTADLDGCVRQLRELGYDQWVGLEYAPLETTMAGLRHQPRA